MDDGTFTPNPSMFGNIDYDFMDQLLDEGCWLQTADGSNLLQPGASVSRSLSFPAYPLPSLEVAPPPSSYQEARERWSISPSPSHQSSSKGEGSVESQCQDQKAITAVEKSPSQARSFNWDGDELNRILWIAPKANPGPSTSVTERLMRSIYHLRELNKNRDVLIQLWVPKKRGPKILLTTVEQPHFYQRTNTRLLHFRDVSEKYEFLADEDTKQALGLPGRVYLGKAPEWTPDVRFFRQEEYPRVDYANMYDVRGSIALPVFERGNGNCLGVVEIITTTEKINYRPEVESVCKALESVDLRSSESLSTSHDQARRECYDAVLPEILNVLRTVSDAHNLPLAQTWAPCSQQGKGGCWHSDKSAICVSTVDPACYVRDHRILEYHKACTEHHLLRGRGGIVGKAFENNQPCFATDITEFSKADYPLSHHAKMFGLHAALAMRLRSNGQEPKDYVLEFYLPSDIKERGLMLHDRICKSVSRVIQQTCQSLILVVGVEQQGLFPGKQTKDESQRHTQEGPSWFSHMMDPQRKGKEVALSLDFGEKEASKDYQEMANWSNTKTDLQLGQVFSDCEDIKQECTSQGMLEGACGSLSGGRLPLGARKAGEKRRTKAQKTISLEVLRQYFAGSLKDAAKNIGVCPTTLKRICRQHGITRWPSRKIKKVGHSLRKLQLVIDSVQGAEGSIKLSSFYTNFPELGRPNTLPNLNDQAKQQLSTQPEGSLFGSGGTTSNSPSTSSSQTSTSSHCFSSGAKMSSLVTANTSCNKDTSTGEEPGGTFKRARSEAELQALAKKEHNQLLERSQSNKTMAEHLTIETLPSLPIFKSWPSRDIGGFKVKATLGEEKVRFTIFPNMGFRDLQQEIAKRFNLDDLSRTGIKYLDDDKEWVLLTCDADLEECIDIHRSSESHTIKLTVSNSSLGGSLGSSGLS